MMRGRSVSSVRASADVRRCDAVDSLPVPGSVDAVQGGRQRRGVVQVHGHRRHPAQLAAGAPLANAEGVPVGAADVRARAAAAGGVGGWRGVAGGGCRAAQGGADAKPHVPAGGVRRREQARAALGALGRGRRGAGGGGAGRGGDLGVLGAEVEDERDQRGDVAQLLLGAAEGVGGHFEAQLAHAPEAAGDDALQRVGEAAGAEDGVFGPNRRKDAVGVGAKSTRCSGSRSRAQR
jgi:hypothetical protein